MDPRDITNVLPRVEYAPSSPPRRRLTAVWRKACTYGSLVLWTWAVLTGAGVLVLIDWAMWNAR